MKKTTKQDADDWLRKNSPHIIIKFWGGSSRKKSKFLDKRRNREFESEFRWVKSKINKNKNSNFGHTTFSEAKIWLEKNFPHIIIKTWGGKANSVSCFCDINRKVNFHYSFKYVKNMLLRNNTVIFYPSKEELRNKIAANRKINPYVLLKKGVYEKYGVENISFHKETLERRNASLRKRYRNKVLLEKTVSKRKISLIKKYGVDNPQRCKEVVEKTRKTCVERYGVEKPLMNSDILEKVKNTKIANGNLATVNGKTLVEISKEKGCSYSYLSWAYRNFGPEIIDSISPGQTLIEEKVKNFLEKHKIFYVQNKALVDKIRPDFYIPEYKLILECDGLYWHSDLHIDKFYHKNKKSKYCSSGYGSLFFREDEILEKFEIVSSMILKNIDCVKNIISKDDCRITMHDNGKFFRENHLFGFTKGRKYFLEYENNVVFGVNVLWHNKNKKILCVSRVAEEKNTIVEKAFDKLIKYIAKKEHPRKIITFIDKRFESEINLGPSWNYVHTKLSYKWCKNQKTFLNNNHFYSYKNGYTRIWDCGKSKFELLVKQ